MVLAVAATRLPDLHSAVSQLASIESIEHWYEVDPNQPDTFTPVTVLDPPAHEPPAPAGKTAPKAAGVTLVDGILSLANGGTDGISRHVMRTWAERNGFNVGSVSPTLVKLVASKRLKRIGKGVYAVTAKSKK